jgi:hypothetical protein
MSSREFTDRRGIRWRVTEIVPQFAERRKGDRRAVGETPPPAVDVVIERRAAERRHITAVRATVTTGYERGWLTFESPDEKRRLAPVPTGWKGYSAERLELLCRMAQVVEQRFGRLIE